MLRINFMLLVFVAIIARMTIAIPMEHASPIAMGEHIGIFIATFDPPNLVHDHAIKTALAENSFSRIVVIPTDFTPHKLWRTDTTMRHAMLQEAYLHDDNVLTVAPYRYGYPQSQKLIEFLREHHQVKTTRVVLSDDLLSSVNRTVIPWMLPTDEELVVDVMDASKSADIKNYFLTNDDFFHMPSDEILLMSEEQLPLLDSVKQFIRDHELYRATACVERFGFITDLYRAWVHDEG